MVPGEEDLRTSLDQGLRIEKHVRGTPPGFNTPSFVVDTMGGGGKRDAHSFEHYNRETGIAVFTSQSVKPGVGFLYFDPIRSLDQATPMGWSIPEERKRMINDALEAMQEPRGLAATLIAECSTWLRPHDIVLARGGHWPLRREFHHGATLVSMARECSEGLCVR